MDNVLDFPSLIFVFSCITLLLSVLAGARLRKKLGPLKSEDRADFSVVQAATLTLLGLLIGFTFSMAINRYEQRKNCEEAEANAIGTEYIRADVLPVADAAKVRQLLRSYLNERLLFYKTRDNQELQRIDADTTRLQSDLWSAVRVAPGTQVSSIVTLTVSGMNDVLNAQGYTQAAWWNRIPFEAWVLLIVIAVSSNLLLGYGAHRLSIVFVVVPLTVSLSFFLVADIDSPRRGIIQVQPQNLISLSQSLPSQ